MNPVEWLIVQALTSFASPEAVNAFLREPRHTALLVGALIALCGGLLGAFLLLRNLSLTSDAISHTVLLGIVVAFLFMTGVLGMEADLSSPLLIVGATLSGVATVLLTEFIHRSGLVKEDAALGLAFPFLFAISIVLVTRYTDNVHLDTDAVLTGDIGLAWANTNAHCLTTCENITITPEHPQARFKRVCDNCQALGISPRSDQATFSQVCDNCGTYTPSQAYSAGLTDSLPSIVFFPKALGTMSWLTLLCALFVLIFYKELKLATFDSGLAHALGFKPAIIHYALMVMVSLIAVGAFQAVGSILVVAFFVLPAATAYLLTDRLGVMLALSPALGMFSVWAGYDLAGGRVLGMPVFAWNTSISASIVLAMFALFLLAWVLSPRYGVLVTLAKRAERRAHFANQLVLGHIYNHENTDEAEEELRVGTLHEHFRWTRAKTSLVVARLLAQRLVIRTADGAHLALTPQGRESVAAFLRELKVR
jgi:manganese/zinc/iron transport system permease protein